MDIIEQSNLTRQFLFRNNDIGKSKSSIVKQKLKDCDKAIDFIKSYHGTPMDWQLEMTSKIREARWFNYAEIKTTNKQCAYLYCWLKYFFEKGLK